MKPWIHKYWLEYRSLLIFILLMVTFRSSFADWNEVPTGSMQPTIVEGDRILVNKLAYDIHLPFSKISLKKLADPVRGDIIVFDSTVSDVRLVKRVIGVPGDSIAMRNNRLTINGEDLIYDQTSASDTDRTSTDFTEHLFDIEHPVRINAFGSQLSSFAPITVPKNYYLVLGDNRDNSADSRVIGLVPRNEVIGRTRTVVMSLNYENNYLPRSERFLLTL
jgi:signal peptidase I